MKLLALVVLVAACDRREPAKPAVVSVVADATLVDAAPSLLGGARELITGVIDDWTSTSATLRRYRRDGDRWTPIGDAWPAVIGAAGAAWGIGLHGNGPPAGRSGPRKREGDDASPAGAFLLRGSYGYARSAPRGTKLAYTPVDAAWKCVDDPRSSHYDHIVDRRTVTGDWSSAEDMRRSDDLYTWVIDIDHNPSHTAGSGSCIFFHAWGGATAPTVGCTAMATDKLTDLLATLDPSAAFVLLPKAEYAALAAAWGLPVI